MEGDPRKTKFSPIDKWEEGVEDAATADGRFLSFERKLSELGIALSKDSKILEVGSGNNIFLQHLQDLGYDAVGLDARPRGDKAEKVVRARIERLPFRDNAFEFVISHAVFDADVYFQDQDEMAKEIVRVLKPGGVYYGALNMGSEIQFEEYFETLKSPRDEFDDGVYRKR